MDYSKFRDYGEYLEECDDRTLRILQKNRTDYKRLLELRDKLSPEWWQWLEWDDRRRCITYKQGYSPNERLNIKYHLNLKSYDTKRNYRAEECSGQRKADVTVAA